MGRRVLMWVGHVALREALFDVLHDSGYRVEAPRHRLDVLAHLSREARGHLHRPDVVLVDADDDGDVVARTRQLLPDVPVVVLTSPLAFEARGDVQLGKPFRVEDLLEAMTGVLGEARAGAARGAPDVQRPS